MSEALDQLLNHQAQLDPHGERVGVSRQAIDEVATEIERLWDENARLRVEMSDVIDHADKVMRYLRDHGANGVDDLLARDYCSPGERLRMAVKSARAALGSAS